MDRKIIKFDDNEIEKYKLHQHKIPTSINSTDFHKIVVSNEISFGKRDFKFFIGYKDVKKLDLYVYSVHKWVHIEEILMHVLIKNYKLLEKYNTIWEKVSNSIKKVFNSEPVSKNL